MKLVLSSLLMVAASASLVAQDAKGIMTEVQKRTTVDSQQYQGVLEVIESNGKSSEKRWGYERIGSNGTSKVVIRFSAPAEVKGVALLVFNYPDRASDQWMWTPAINRERRVATQDRRSRFFGTDFSFEDLEERDIAQFEYRLQGEEAIAGEPCWKIVATPVAGKKSQYTQSTYWIRKSNYTYAQIENFTDGKLIRRVQYKQVENIQGINTARVIEVEDVTRKSRTILRLESVAYNAKLSADQFTLPALRRS
jgi:hypothetical protein